MTHPSSSGRACCTRCGSSCSCSVPGCLDLSPVRTSERGLYRAELAPELRPLPLDTPTTWWLTIAALTGDESVPCVDARLTIDGGMPQRGLRWQGRPTSTVDAAGRYRIAGLAFTYPGWWLLRVLVDAPAGLDVVTFNLAV